VLQVLLVSKYSGGEFFFFSIALSFAKSMSKVVCRIEKKLSLQTRTTHGSTTYRLYYILYGYNDSDVFAITVYDLWIIYIIYESFNDFHFKCVHNNIPNKRWHNYQYIYNISIRRYVLGNNH